jgi:hypothetical protein
MDARIKSGHDISFVDTLPRSRRASTRVLPRTSCLRNSEGAGNAGRPMRPQPRVQNKIKHERSYHRSTGFTGIPRAMVLTVSFALSPVCEFQVATVIGRLKVCPIPVGMTNLRRFSTSNGCQDHTTSPSAKASFVCVPFVSSRAFDPPCHPLTSPDALASTASRPALVTTRDRPSVRRDGGGYRFDLGKARSGIFLREGLDRNLVICPSGTIGRRNVRSALPDSTGVYDTQPATMRAPAGVADVIEGIEPRQLTRRPA